MDINVTEVIDYMKRWDKKVMTLNNGWNIKALNDYSNFEVFNDDGNTIIDCPSLEALKNIIETIKD